MGKGSQPPEAGCPVRSSDRLKKPDQPRSTSQPPTKPGPSTYGEATKTSSITFVDTPRPSAVDPRQLTAEEKREYDFNLPNIHDQRDPGFTLVQPKKKNRTRQNSASSSGSCVSDQSSASVIPRNVHFTVHISNIPEPYSTQKSFYSLLCQIQAPITSLSVLRGGRATIQSNDPNISKILTQLRGISDTIVITPVEPRPKNPANSTSSSAPVFSCVVRNVDSSILADDVSDALEKQGILALRTWRIKSRATNQETSMFRILTRDIRSLDTLLRTGFTMFYRRYQCEPSKSPGAQPLQCGRCLAFGHPTSSCRSPRVCPRCSQPHPPSQTCATPTPKCANCDGSHPAYSHACPRRPREITSPSMAAPIRSIDPPAEDLSEDSDDGASHTHSPEVERFARVDDVIGFVQNVLLNVFPHFTARILLNVVEPALQCFRRSVHSSISGNKIHVTYEPAPKSNPPWVRRP